MNTFKKTSQSCFVIISSFYPIVNIGRDVFIWISEDVFEIKITMFYF